MNLSDKYKRAFIIAIIFAAVVTVVAVAIYSSLSKWQNAMVEKNKLICELYAIKIYDATTAKMKTLGDLDLFGKADLSSNEIKLIDNTLKELAEKELKEGEGLEGGFYLVGSDSFFGYSFPTSPPPVPVYGPPPRSYNIIKMQSLESIVEDSVIINLHSFDAATFPLATKPIIFGTNSVGAIWVRIHIQNEMPVIKVKQAINRAAIISILGFLVLMLLSALLTSEIKGIKKEMEHVSRDPSFRLSNRWGIFGYISSNVNEMLNKLEEENNHHRILEQELNQKEKLASLGNMVAGVAHEVKTPLAIIKTRIQIWQKVVENNAEIAKYISPEGIKLVIDETNRLSNLVKRLLIFSRPISKNLKLTDINRLIYEVVALFDVDSSKVEINVRQGNNGTVPMIMVDENSIRQVIINVLENSIEAMPEGGTINIVTDLINDGKNVVIEVNDTGTGISDDIRKKVFDPFFTSKESGVGLGLSVSYQIIKAHNGEIGFINNRTGGTKCIIKLPVQK